MDRFGDDAMSRSFEDLVARSREIRKVRTLTRHTGVVCHVAFSPDSHLLASGTYSNSIRLWEVEAGRGVRVLEGHTAAVRSLAFSPSGQLLASASADKTVRLWSVVTDVAEQPLDLPSLVHSVAFSPRGQMVALALDDVQLWDLKSRSLFRTLSGHESFIRDVAFSPDGRFLASSSDKTVRLWDVDSGQSITALNGHTGPVTCVALSPDSQVLATASSDSTVKLWDVTSGESIQTHRFATIVNVVVWSPDGSLVFARSKNANDAIRILHAETGRLIHALPQLGSQEDRGWWITRALAVSPDGRYLVTYTPDSLNDLDIWDISSLDVGPKPTIEPSILSTTTDVCTPIRLQLRTLPLSHASSPTFPPGRAALWLQGAAAANRPLPLALARDLGLILSTPQEELKLAKPDALPFDEDTSAYLAFLLRVAAYPLVRDLPLWRPPLSDAVIAVVLARLVDGLDLPDGYRPISGAAGVLFTRYLTNRLTDADPAALRRQTPRVDRPHLAELLPEDALARIERNLHVLDTEELRFLARYGPALPGSPDPRELLDMLALTGLPAVTRLALTQTLKLLPRVSAERTVGGVQTYPEGGYEGLARQGSLDNLLRSELAFPPAVFFHRVLNKEALYYGRERPRGRRRELAYVVVQTGVGLGGDGVVLSKALLLALGQALGRRGYEVLYSFAGPELEEPHRLSHPGDVARVLHYQDSRKADAAAILAAVLRHLQGWREMYRGRQVMWVVTEDFDADDAEDHRPLYRALAAEAGQQAWYVRVGRSRREEAPVTAGFFARWQLMETGVLWEGQGVPERPPVEPVVRPREPEAGDLWTDPVLGIEFSYIPAGTFLMGSPETEEGRWDDETQHRVTLTHGYWLARTQVTQGQFERFVSATGHKTVDSERWRRSGGERHPVVSVSWEDAQAFCGWLSAEAGEGFRLPTEAEWERAARAGTEASRYEADLDTIGWYRENSGGSSHPVGEKRANGWGLSDMLGNVYEWVEDAIENLSASDTYVDSVDPLGLEGSRRVFRGGRWANAPRFLRAAFRDATPPTSRGYGFRLAATLPRFDS